MIVAAVSYDWHKHKQNTCIPVGPIGVKGLDVYSPLNMPIGVYAYRVYMYTSLKSAYAVDTQ